MDKLISISSQDSFFLKKEEIILFFDGKN